MFGSQRPDFSDPALDATSCAAYDHLVANVAALGRETRDDDTPLVDATAAWAIVHGLADLMQAGRLDAMRGLPTDERDALLTRIITRFGPPPAGT